MKTINAAAAASFIFLLTILLHNPHRIAAVVADQCNATAAGSSIAGLCTSPEELLMESETTRRFLQQSRSVSLNSLEPKRPYCNRDTYGSCIGASSKTNRRNCNYNTCLRGK